MFDLEPDAYLPLIRLALVEDVGSGDATTQALIDRTARTEAAIVAREEVVVAGLEVAAAVFREVSGEVAVKATCEDGARCRAHQVLLGLRGPAAAILTAERVALNFLQRLSGVATLTSRYVAEIQGTRARILDTRKTTPGWRRLEKYAVRRGGGTNHRLGLADLILIKDNHLAVLSGRGPNPIADAVRRSRAAFPSLRVEVEADSLEQVGQAVEAGADIVLLDNMSLETMRQAVGLARGRCLLEASGGVRLDTVRAIAETGVDYISVGALTHSAPAVDIALDFQTATG